jgi:hypothetical protein
LDFKDSNKSTASLLGAPGVVFLLHGAGQVVERDLRVAQGVGGLLQGLGDLGVVGLHVVDGLSDLLLHGDVPADVHDDALVGCHLDGDERRSSDGDHDLIALLRIPECL